MIVLFPNHPKEEAAHRLAEREAAYHAVLQARENAREACCWDVFTSSGVDLNHVVSLRIAGFETWPTDYLWNGQFRHGDGGTDIGLLRVRKDGKPRRDDTSTYWIPVHRVVEQLATTGAQC